MRDDDAHYYRHRAEVEADLSRTAVEPGAISAHHQLASLYRERAQEGEKPQPVRSE